MNERKSKIHMFRRQRGWLRLPLLLLFVLLHMCCVRVRVHDAYLHACACACVGGDVCSISKAFHKLLPHKASRRVTPQPQYWSFKRCVCVSVDCAALLPLGYCCLTVALRLLFLFFLACSLLSITHPVAASRPRVPKNAHTLTHTHTETNSFASLLLSI